MKTKIRVLHVLKSSIYSGAENVAMTIIKQLESDYEMAYLATDGENRRVLERENIRKYLIATWSRTNIRAVISDFKPDIVHAHDFAASVFCSSIAGKFYIISHLHYDPPWVKRWNLKTIMYALCISRISTILAVSNKSYDNMVFSKWFSEKKVIVGNPIDSDKIRKLGEVDAFVPACDLLFVGRLVEQKNPQRFLDIVNRLCAEGLDVNCIMLGSGKLEAECLRLIETYGLEKHVQMVGFKENPYAYMNKAKILCMTSKWEGYGLVILEAHIMGIPVLTSHTSGATEILGGDSYELCATDEEFIDKIKNLLVDDKKYQICKQKILRLNSDILTVNDYMERLSKVYQELL